MEIIDAFPIDLDPNTVTANLKTTDLQSIAELTEQALSTFFSCRLCPRERCEGRTARYDETTAREYGILK